MPNLEITGIVATYVHKWRINDWLHSLFFLACLTELLFLMNPLPDPSKSLRMNSSGLSSNCSWSPSRNSIFGTTTFQNHNKVTFKIMPGMEDATLPFHKLMPILLQLQIMTCTVAFQRPRSRTQLHLMSAKHKIRNSKKSQYYVR